MPSFDRSIRTAAVAFLALLATAATVCARQESAGRETPPALPAISERMRRFIDDHEISGAVTLVATPDRIVHLDATGKADIAEGKPMRPDTIFWIASMTKPITATAVLMLQDEGKLSVDDPVEKYLPEFKDLKTADGKPGTAHDPPPAHAHLRHGRGHALTRPVRSRTWPGSSRSMSQNRSPSSRARSGPTASRESTPPRGSSRSSRASRSTSSSSSGCSGPLGMKDTTFYLTEAAASAAGHIVSPNGQGDARGD